MIRLRPAALYDIPLLRHWDQQPHVVEGKGTDDWAWERELARTPDWREQLIAEVDSRPIGFIQIIDPAREDTHYWGDCPANWRAIDIWIGDASALGRGLGSQMMRLAIERCFADDRVEAIVVDPMEGNNGARRFYERLGFRRDEACGCGDDDTAVYRLDRAAWAAQDPRRGSLTTYPRQPC